MDLMDIRLLQALARNARASVSDLARSLDLARSTVQTRLEKLERDGTIAGFSLRLGDHAVVVRIRATVLLQISPRAAPALLSRLRAMPEVERAHSSSGRFDLILQLAAETTTALDEALDRIGAFDGVTRSESLIHLATKIDRAI